MSYSKPKLDKLFSQPTSTSNAGSFEFDQRVVDVFDDMVSRSVPGYQTIQLLVADLALEFYQGNLIYDLGCSTGTTIKSLCTRAQQCNRELPRCIGVDSSEEMIVRAKATLESSLPVNFLTADIAEPGLYKAGTADVVLLILSLQFIRPILRQKIINEAFHAIRPGGALILVEKTVEVDKVLNGFYVEYYHRFKKEMGYSDLEISNKREALENVLIPYQRDENLGLLTRAGFSSAATFFQWFNFAGFLGIKM